jgi:hypothetical protein
LLLSGVYLVKTEAFEAWEPIGPWLWLDTSSPTKNPALIRFGRDKNMLEMPSEGFAEVSSVGQLFVSTRFLLKELRGPECEDGGLKRLVLRPVPRAARPSAESDLGQNPLTGEQFGG